MHYLLRPLACLLLCTLLLTGCVPTDSGGVPPSQVLGTSTQTDRVAAPALKTTAWPAVPSARPAIPSTPPAAPTVVPTIPPTSTPVPAVLDLSAQAAALLPPFAADLAGAEVWDHYQISATLDPTALTVSGTQRMLVRNGADVPFAALYFHLYPNHPDFGGELSVADVRVNDQPVPVTTEQDGVLLRVDLPQPLAPGQQARVTMNFLAYTQRNASGSAYGAFNQEAGVWSLASFYPVLARYFADGWDRRPVSSRGDLAVTETALYDVTLDTPVDWQLVTTGTQVETNSPGNLPPEGYRRERFVSGPQRDFFLAAINGLNQASTDVDGTRVTVYYRPEYDAAGQRSLAIAAQSLRAFNARYGPYPLTEMEVVQAALTKFLGVEYPGVMLIEQRLYASNGRGLETTIAHEVAHQWWYSLVGNDYQGAAWLDEGLASYSQVIYYESLGDAVSAAAELQQFRNIYLSARNAGNDGVVNRPNAAFQGNYVALVYAKSALFFHALRQRMGDETFYAFLQRYYETYRYGEATGSDMLATAEATCGCDLQALYDAWITSAVPVDVP
jgi:hypothetical protein